MIKRNRRRSDYITPFFEPNGGKHNLMWLRIEAAWAKQEQDKKGKSTNEHLGK